MHDEDPSLEKPKYDTPRALSFWNRNIWLITLFQVAFLFILISTMIIAIPSVMDYLNIEYDAAMTIFPFLAYIPHTLSIIIILQIIKRIIERSVEDKGIDFYSLFQWDKDYSKKINLVRKVSISLVIFITAISWIFGIATIPMGESLLFSPMNMITLSSTLSFLVIWLSLGITQESRKAVLYLLILLVFNSLLHTWAVVLADDTLVLPFTLSYQVLAIVLCGFRWLNLQFMQ